jgi:hypothetical protein
VKGSVGPDHGHFPLDFPHAGELRGIHGAQKPSLRRGRAFHGGEKSAAHLFGTDGVAGGELHRAESIRVEDQGAKEVPATLHLEVVLLAKLVPALVEGGRFVRIAAIEGRLVFDALANERVVQCPALGGEKVHRVARFHIDDELHRRLAHLRIAEGERREVRFAADVMEAVADGSKRGGIGARVRRTGRCARMEPRGGGRLWRAREDRALGPTHEVDAVEGGAARTKESDRTFELVRVVEREGGLRIHRDHHAGAGGEGRNGPRKKRARGGIGIRFAGREGRNAQRMLAEVHRGAPRVEDLDEARFCACRAEGKLRDAKWRRRRGPTGRPNVGLEDFIVGERRRSRRRALVAVAARRSAVGAVGEGAGGVRGAREGVVHGEGRKFHSIHCAAPRVYKFNDVAVRVEAKGQVELTLLKLRVRPEKHAFARREHAGGQRRGVVGTVAYGVIGDV